MLKLSTHITFHELNNTMHKNVKKESESIIQYLSVLRGVRLTVLCEGTQGSHISHNNGSLIEQLKRPGDQYEILL
jgi:hypothetical protein